ncbi:MAG: RDD family protein [Ignavibacteria bacterium]|nr:RDD family protein [Ignavibacteria bacterium]
MENKIHRLSLILSRLFAFLIDVILLGVLFGLVFTFYPEFFDEITIEKIFLLLISFELYFFLFEILFNASVGKLLFGLKVYHTSEKNFSSKVRRVFDKIFNLFIRNFLRVVIIIPPLFVWNEILFLIFAKGRSISESITNIRVDFKN